MTCHYWESMINRVGMLLTDGHVYDTHIQCISSGPQPWLWSSVPSETELKQYISFQEHYDTFFFPWLFSSAWENNSAILTCCNRQATWGHMFGASPMLVRGKGYLSPTQGCLMAAPNLSTWSCAIDFSCTTPSRAKQRLLRIMQTWIRHTWWYSASVSSPCLPTTRNAYLPPSPHCLPGFSLILRWALILQLSHFHDFQIFQINPCELYFFSLHVHQFRKFA